MGHALKYLISNCYCILVPKLVFEYLNVDAMAAAPTKSEKSTEIWDLVTVKTNAGDYSSALFEKTHCSLREEQMLLQLAN